MRTKVRTILDCTPELDPSWPGGLEEGSEGRLVDSMREREVLVRTIDVLNLGATLTKELDDQLLTTLGLIVEETGRVGLGEIMLGRDDYHAFGHWLGPSGRVRGDIYCAEVADMRGKVKTTSLVVEQLSSSFVARPRTSRAPK